MRIRPVRAAPCGRTNRRPGRQTDMKKSIVAFRNFAKAPKNGFVITQLRSTCVTDIYSIYNSDYVIFCATL
jgi:hypothetical protein